MSKKDFATYIDPDIEFTPDQIMDTQGSESLTFMTLTQATTEISLQHGDESDLSDVENVDDDWLIVADANGVVTGGDTATGTQGYVLDTSTFPIATQATKTEKVTVDGGTEQTVTFTTAIDIGTVTDNDTYPLADQDGNTEKVTIDGGTEQTVTFAGVTTSVEHVQTQMDAQLTGCTVTVVSGHVKITSDTSGASSSVVIGTGTTDLTWAAPADENSLAGIVSEMDAQLTGCSVIASGGQVKITSYGYGLGSTVSIGTGTTDMTWDTPVAGAGGTGTYVLYDDAVTATIGYVGHKRYVRIVTVNPSADPTILALKGDLLRSPAQ